MASCPICQKEIEIHEQNLGALFNCPHCSAVYFVGWDGQPELSPAPPPEVEIQATTAPFPTEPSSMGVDLQPTPSSDFSPTDSSSPSEASPETFSDVTAFGNSNQEEGALTYHLRIRGIDLGETRRELRDALSDSRFGWIAEEIMAQVDSSGELMIRNMNPAKAAILVGRIKFLPLQIDWTQEVFSAAT